MSEAAPVPDLPRPVAPLLGFARLLRFYGFSVAPEQTVAFLAAIALLGPRSMRDIQQAAVATLAPPPDRRDEFDALFRSHFYGETILPSAADEDEEAQVRDDAGTRERRPMAVERQDGSSLAASAERLAVRRFDPGETDRALLRLRRVLPRALPTRRSLRTVRTTVRGRVDLRRSLRAIARADGDVPQPLLRRRPLVSRRLLLLIDISGSMRPYTQGYLRVAHAVVQAAARAEVFTFGTRLTRITRSLRLRDRAQALADAAAQVVDWDGGTRIGPSLAAFLAVPRFAAFARGAAILILSDALERGDHAEMERAIRRLGLAAFRLSLCTPLAGDPRFRPETAALRAILPLLDDLVDGSSVVGLAEFILSLGRPAPPAASLWRRAS